MLTSSDKAIVVPILRSIGALVDLVDVLEDGSFRYFAHNLASEADLGIPISGPIEGSRPEEILSPDHAAQLNHYYRLCVSTRHSVQFEGVRDTPIGRRWANHFLSPIFDLNGNVVRILGTVIEITERRRAEQALAESEARLRALYDDNPAKLLTLDFEGRILSINKFGAEHVGFQPEEMLGRSCFEFMHPEDRPPGRAFPQTDRSAARGGASGGISYAAQQRDLPMVQPYRPGHHGQHRPPGDPGRR